MQQPFRPLERRAFPGDPVYAILLDKGLLLRAVKIVGDFLFFAAAGKGLIVEQDAAVNVEEILLNLQIFLVRHSLFLLSC